MNLAHTLLLEYMKMYSLVSPHRESITTVSVKSRVVLVMSTQYSVRGRAFHVTVRVFGATTNGVRTVSNKENYAETIKILTHHEQLEMLWMNLLK